MYQCAVGRRIFRFRADPRRPNMPLSKFTSAFTSFPLALTFAVSAFAQEPPLPTIEMVSTSVNVGIGGQSGDGVLRLPNLGTNCAYRFKVDGFGAGIKVGISKVTATGPVVGMTKVA